MKGLIADANIRGHVEYPVRRMQAEPWVDSWQALGLGLRRFEDVGLSESSSDLGAWNACQAEQLILITDNRTLDSDDSLEAVVRRNDTIESLPVFTIADVDAFRTSDICVERVVEARSGYLLRIDEVRGTGRLHLPWGGRRLRGDARRAARSRRTSPAVSSSATRSSGKNTSSGADRTCGADRSAIRPEAGTLLWRAKESGYNG